MKFSDGEVHSCVLYISRYDCSGVLPPLDAEVRLRISGSEIKYESFLVGSIDATHAEAAYSQQYNDERLEYYRLFTLTSSGGLLVNQEFKFHLPERLLDEEYQIGELSLVE